MNSPMNPPFKMKLAALEEVPSRTGGLPMFRLTGTVDKALQVFMVPFGVGADLREKMRELYGFKRMFDPPAALELHGRWRGDTGLIFDATLVKAEMGRSEERAPAQPAQLAQGSEAVHGAKRVVSGPSL